MTVDSENSLSSPVGTVLKNVYKNSPRRFSKVGDSGYAEEASIMARMGAEDLTDVEFGEVLEITSVAALPPLAAPVILSLCEVAPFKVIS